MRHYHQMTFWITAVSFLTLGSLIQAQGLSTNLMAVDANLGNNPSVQPGFVSPEYVLGFLNPEDSSFPTTQQEPAPQPARLGCENPKSLAMDSTIYPMILASTAMIVAVVALTRSRTVPSMPVINVHVPATPPAKPQKNVRHHQKTHSSNNHYDLGPSYAEERAHEADQVQQAEESVLMGLVENNIAMRSAIANLPEETPCTSDAETVVSTKTD